MKLKILTPDRLVLDQEVDLVTIPGSEGEMTVLPKHTALVATLKSGSLRYRVSGKTQESLFIEGGFLEVLQDQVLILTKSSQTQGSNPAHH